MIFAAQPLAGLAILMPSSSLMSARVSRYFRYHDIIEVAARYGAGAPYPLARYYSPMRYFDAFPRFKYIFYIATYLAFCVKLEQYGAESPSLLSYIDTDARPHEYAHYFLMPSALAMPRPQSTLSRRIIAAEISISIHHAR